MKLTIIIIALALGACSGMKQGQPEPNWKHQLWSDQIEYGP